MNLADPNKLMTKDQVCTELHVSGRTLEKNVKAGRFPPGVTLGGKNLFWRFGVVEKWKAQAFKTQEEWEPPKRARRPSSNA